ncbi:MAG TPA: large conductance mechanosensitive channel protein MscL [Candidatus Tetragenococcus pullicola]|nr:large conductance mechanosensitive channel protein MscL [Candidatus Tetragenococcus pullicola]
MLAEFKEFIAGGDVVDLAVGVVIGSAFTAIVNQVVEGLITPLIGWVVAAITGSNDLESSLSILDVSPTAGVVFKFGDVISALITFIITGFVLFLVVKGVNNMKNFHKAPEEEEAVETAEDYLSEIRDLLRLQQGLPVEQESDETSDAPEESDV